MGQPDRLEEEGRETKHGLVTYSTVHKSTHTHSIWLWMKSSSAVSNSRTGWIMDFKWPTLWWLHHWFTDWCFVTDVLTDWLVFKLVYWLTGLQLLRLLNWLKLICLSDRAIVSRRLSFNFHGSNQLLKLVLIGRTVILCLVYESLTWYFWRDFRVKEKSIGWNSICIQNVLLLPLCVILDHFIHVGNEILLLPTHTFWRIIRVCEQCVTDQHGGCCCCCHEGVSMATARHESWVSW